MTVAPHGEERQGRDAVIPALQRWYQSAEGLVHLHDDPSTRQRAGNAPASPSRARRTAARSGWRNPMLVRGSGMDLAATRQQHRVRPKMLRHGKRDGSMNFARQMDGNVMRSIGNGWLRLLQGTLIVFLSGLLVACGDEEEVATDREVVPDVTPAASDELPQGIEAATLEISDGEFVADELLLQQGEPTVLRVINSDDTAYQLEIGDLVPATSIPAGATTEVEFTTPKAGTYTGQLQAEDGAPVSEFVVTVQPPGGVE